MLACFAFASEVFVTVTFRGKTLCRLSFSQRLGVVTAGPFSPMQVSLKSGTNVLYWRTTGVTVGAKAVKPVLLKNIHIEGTVPGKINTDPVLTCPAFSLFILTNVFFSPYIHQVWHTCQSACPVNQEHSVTTLALPHVNHVPGTHTQDEEPAPALPVTQRHTTHVRI